MGLMELARRSSGLPDPSPQLTMEDAKKQQKKDKEFEKRLQGEGGKNYGSTDRSYSTGKSDSFFPKFENLQ